jgi:signal transduction histidine kinase
VDLNAAVASIGRLLDRVLGSKITLKIEPSEDKPLVHADPGMLDQVLMNLAVNARDAMTGTGTLIISTGLVRIAEPEAGRNPEVRAGKFASLNVTDTGCGMDEATMRRIFDPFFTTKPNGRGTGLGLSVSYGIIKEHAGKIDVRSTPGKGTSFHVEFPAARKAAHV